jgi:hypothetical protein
MVDNLDNHATAQDSESADYTNETVLQRESQIKKKQSISVLGQHSQAALAWPGWGWRERPSLVWRGALGFFAA